MKYLLFIALCWLTLWWLQLAPPAWAAPTPSYHFRLSDNRINWQVAAPAPAVTVSSTPAPAIAPTATPPVRWFWQLTYRLGSTGTLPAALPVAVVRTSDDEVAFVLTTAAVDDAPQLLCAELSPGQALPQLQLQPLLTDLSADWSVVLTEESCAAPPAPRNVDALLLVREADGTLTVLFSQSDDSVRPAQYLLSCAETQQQRLLWQRHFLWPHLRLLSGSSNNAELLFQVSDFTCTQQAQLTDLLSGQQINSTIISVEELYATD